MNIALIRHPPPSIAPGICYGRLNAGLAASACDQIRRIATDPGLSGAVQVWTSPATRCRLLANAIAETLALPLAIDPRLQELDFGDWEGQSWDAIPRPDLDRWAADPLRFAPPRGESGAALIDRVRDFHARLCEDHQDCIVVSHGGPLKLLTAMLLGAPVDLLAAAPQMGTIRLIPEAENRSAEPAKQPPSGRQSAAPAKG